MNRMAAMIGIACLSAHALAAPARAEFGPPPVAPRAGIEQHLAAQLPLGLVLSDAQGRRVRLGDYFHAGRPVVLVLGYYTCPNLCGVLMHGTLEALQANGLPSTSYEVVGVSIDPLDTPATAAARARVYADYAAFLHTSHPGTAAPATPQLLIGQAASIAALVQRVGFVYQRNDVEDVEDPAARAPSRFAHAAGIVVATPTGRISRYLMGVRFEPQPLRLALVEASSGHIGTLADRIALLCAHFDPTRGRYSMDVMNALRVIGILLVLALAGFAWRHRHTGAAVATEASRGGSRP
jgi:protein SCO1/2